MDESIDRTQRLKLSPAVRDGLIGAAIGFAIYLLIYSITLFWIHAKGLPPLDIVDHCSLGKDDLRWIQLSLNPTWLFNENALGAVLTSSLPLTMGGFLIGISRPAINRVLVSMVVLSGLLFLFYVANYILIPFLAIACDYFN